MHGWTGARASFLTPFIFHATTAVKANRKSAATFFKRQNELGTRESETERPATEAAEAAEDVKSTTRREEKRNRKERRAHRIATWE